MLSNLLSKAPLIGDSIEEQNAATNLKLRPSILGAYLDKLKRRGASGADDRMDIESLTHSILGKWNTRWINIEGHYIRWYQNVSSSQARGSLDLRWITCIREVDDVSRVYRADGGLDADIAGMVTSGGLVQGVQGSPSSSSTKKGGDSPSSSPSAPDSNSSSSSSSNSSNSKIIAFCLDSPRDGRSLVLQCSSQEERSKWVRMLHFLCDRARGGDGSRALPNSPGRQYSPRSPRSPREDNGKCPSGSNSYLVVNTNSNSNSNSKVSANLSRSRRGGAVLPTSDIGPDFGPDGHSFDNNLPKGKSAVTVSGIRKGMNKGGGKTGVELSLDRLTAVESQLEQLADKQKSSAWGSVSSAEEEEVLARVARAIINDAGNVISLLDDEGGDVGMDGETEKSQNTRTSNSNSYGYDNNNGKDKDKDKGKNSSNNDTDVEKVRRGSASGVAFVSTQGNAHSTLAGRIGVYKGDNTSSVSADSSSTVATSGTFTTNTAITATTTTTTTATTSDNVFTLPLPDKDTTSRSARNFNRGAASFSQRMQMNAGSAQGQGQQREQQGSNSSLKGTISNGNGTYTGSVSAADTITSIGSASVASSAQIHASSKRGLRGTGDSGGNVSSTSSKESRDSRDSKGRGAPPSQAPAAYMSGAALVKNGTTDGGSASPRYGQKASPRVDTSEREGRERAFDNMEDDLVYPISPSSSSGSPSSAIRNAPATGRSAGKIAWGNGADRVIGEGSTGSPGVGDFQSPPTLGRRYAADGIVDTSEPPRLSRETGENRTRGAQRNESKESGDIDRERAAKAMGDRDKRNANFTGTGTSSGPRSFTAPTVGSVSIQGASMEDGGTFASSSESAAYSSTSTGSAVGQSQRPRSGLGARLARY